MTKGPINHWVEMNRLLRYYQTITAGLALLLIIVTMVATLLFISDPVVVTLQGNEKQFNIGKRKIVDLNDQDIVQFVSRFLHLRYKFDGMDAPKIMANVKPLVTQGFYKKLSKLLKKAGSSKTKGLKQKILIEDIQVTDQAVLIFLDRIIKLEKIKVVAPLEVAIELVKGRPTVWNPMGVYVNGIIEYDGT